MLFNLLTFLTARLFINNVEADNMNLTNKIDAFSPYLIIFAIFPYVLFGFVGFYYKIRGLQSPLPWVFTYMFYLAAVFI